MKSPSPLLLAGLVLAAFLALWARSAPAAAAGGVDAGATAYGYIVPDQPNFVMVVAPAELGWFHLEARYNYESLHTGSSFAGLNLGTGTRLRLQATGMLGAVFGDVDGVAPGFRVSLAWWILDAYSEGEYLINVHDVGTSFFYSWSELGVSPLGWLRVGGVVQRTRVYHTPLEVQRGLFVGTTLFRFVTAAFYELNLGWASPTYIFALGLRF